MILATLDPEVTAFLLALTPLLVILTTILQSWYQRWVAKTKEAADKLAAEEKAAADKLAAEEKAEADKRALEEAAAKVASVARQTAADTQKTVHNAINGGGLGEKLDATAAKIDEMLAWQKAHDHQDNQRYDDVMARLLNLKTPPGKD